MGPLTQGPPPGRGPEVCVDAPASDELTQTIQIHLPGNSFPARIPDQIQYPENRITGERAFDVRFGNTAKAIRKGPNNRDRIAFEKKNRELFLVCIDAITNPNLGWPTDLWRVTLRPMRFFLIDRIVRWEVGSSAEALKNVALSEDFFDDHFPRRPVMPGVLILEGMAQLSGLLVEASLKQKTGKSAKAIVTVLERTKFRALVKPGETLLYRSDVLSVNESGAKVKATASREGTLITSTEMVFAFKYVDDSQLDAKRQRLMEIWMPDGQPANLK